MAKGKTLPSAQRGIAFSTFMALSISVLILIVGNRTHKETKGGEFTVESLVGIITRLSGEIGIWVFGIGFIAAALSSMLTVPLGAALTAESVLTINNDDVSSIDTHAQSNDGDKDYDIVEDYQIETGFLYDGGESEYDKQITENKDESSREELLVAAITKSKKRVLPKKYVNVLMFVMVAIATCVIAADSPTVLVILIAQVSIHCGLCLKRAVY